MTFLDKLRTNASGHHTARSGVYSHRSVRESVGRRVHADGTSVSRNHDGGSSRVGVGTVLVMLQDTPDGPQPPPLRVMNKDGKLIPRDHFFLAVIAPDNDQALAFLSVQPAGTYVLVKESADDIAVYVKFQTAVRSFPVVAGKDIKRTKPSDELVEWGRAYRPLAVNTPHAEALLGQSTIMTPIHRLYLPPLEFAHLEKCWLQFLPQVQAIAFELCTQSFYMDEEIAMEDWDKFILSSRVPCVAFVSVDSCGFHLFNTNAIANAAATDAGSLSATVAGTAAAADTVPVRVVEFDISKCLISITDGLFRPHALVSPVHFGPTKLFDAELGFSAIRDNFLTPERVALKEVNVGTGPAATATVSSLWQDLHPLAASGDAELQHLLAVRSVVVAMVPHEPLPDGLVDAIATLHNLWAGQTAKQSRGHWRTPAKLKCVAQVLPYYVELFLATAATDTYVLQELARTRKADFLPRFTAALRHDLLFMARRADDATVARLVHHVLQALALRASVPAPLVALASDLCVETAHFRVLFLRNQGVSLLWKAIHTAVTLSALDAISLLHSQAQQPVRAAPPVGELSKRRSSLFGGRRRSNQARGGTRKSLAFNASIVLPVTFETTVHVFFRLNPLLVQLELALALKETDVTTVSPRTPNSSNWTVLSSSAASALGEMIALIERLAFFFIADSASPTWEKDVLQLLRLNDLYDRLYHELVRSAAVRFDDDDVVFDADERVRVATLLECIAALYRLETQRRRLAGPTVGEKKYWFFFHLLRAPIRAFHEHVRAQLYATGDAPSDEASDVVSDCDDASSAEMDSRGFVVLARVLPHLPRPMVTEFVLVSLDDVLEGARRLHQWMLPRNDSVSALRDVRRVLALVTIVLERTHDFDLQLLLVRVLASSGSAMPALLQRLVGVAAYERDVLAFADAFMALATKLPRLEKWTATRAPVAHELENLNDVEANEQRKTMLMATVLSPENGVADSDEILWDTLQATLVPATTHIDGPTKRLAVVDAFYSKAVFTQRDDALTTLSSHKIETMVQYLRLRARLFLSPMLENPRLTTAHLRGFVELHWNYLYDLRQQHKHAPESDTTHARGALAELHLRCLVALASRCASLPALDEAFSDFRTSRELFRILHAGTKSSAYDATMTTLPETDAPSLSLNLGKLKPHAPDSVSLQTTELLLSTPTLHAATLLTVLAGVVSEPHALNERVVPRFFIPTNIDGSSLDLVPDEDLLLSLQRHLRAVDSIALRAALAAGLEAADLDEHFGPPARAHAVRVLVRLLLPDSYDSHLYTRAGPIAATTSIHEHESDETSDTEDDGPEQKMLATAHPREYVAKGAFATVYRTTPCVPDARNPHVAIKVCGHQRTSGELCVAAEVFNEVVVLERLRGIGAATQLLDFGNNTAESLGFELVLEYCPASLTQWRRSLALDEGDNGPRVQFRLLLSLVLGVFLDVARAVKQVHAHRVCHFDIKADNVMLRVEPTALTAALLREPPDAVETGHGAPLPRVCLADFGEASVLPVHAQALQLSRTRGTEAIKSPEMLRVTGGASSTSSGVGPASDVWSLGCLLFELLTRDVMFANDDWAQIYAHLVVPAQATESTAPPVVRDDHKEKLSRVLAPATDAEMGLVSVVVHFLESILTRDAARRPTLDKVMDEAETLRRMILTLPSAPEDDAWIHAAVHARAPDAGAAVAVTATAIATPNHVHRPPPSIGGPTTGRLFFNLYLARDAYALRAAAIDVEVSADAPSSQRTLLHDARMRQEVSALQVAVEPRFGHLVLFCYDDIKRQASNADSDLSTPDRNAPSDSTSGSDAFVEIVEGVGRTVFYFNRARVLACLQSDHAPQPPPRTTTTSVASLSSARGTNAAPADAATTTTTSPATLSLTQLLLQHSRGILAVLERHVRHESCRVLVVPADYRNDSGASFSPLGELTTATLLFFLTTSLGLSPLEALAAMGRNGHALVALPSTRVLSQLLQLHDEHYVIAQTILAVERTVHSRACVRCRCGDKVLGVAAAVVQSSVVAVEPPVVDVDDDMDIVWDPRETRLVVGGSTSARPWPVVDAHAVERLESILRIVLRRHLGVPTTTMRRQSLGHLVSTARPTTATGDGHVPYLLHGLTEQQTTADGQWTLWACRQCGDRVCMANATAGKLALPL